MFRFAFLKFHNPNNFYNFRENLKWSIRMKYTTTKYCKVFMYLQNVNKHDKWTNIKCELDKTLCKTECERNEKKNRMWNKMKYILTFWKTYDLSNTTNIWR